MIVYHQAARPSINAIMQHGLKASMSGSKSQDSAITQTDQYLDSQRPSNLIQANLSRQHNSYAFVPSGANSLINITDGSIIAVDQLRLDSSQVLIQLEVDPQRCFVSNLDMYDAIKAAHQGHADSRQLQELAQKYWRKLIPLSDFNFGVVSRPEVMITYDVPVQFLQRLS